MHTLDTDDVEEAPTNVPKALEEILLLLFPMLVVISTITKKTKDVCCWFQIMNDDDTKPNTRKNLNDLAYDVFLFIEF